MATTNIKLNIVRPAVAISDIVVFSVVANDNDYLRIPQRFPFADIANYSALVTAGYFRHATTAISSELQPQGYSAGTNTQLGFALPRTEKLILLAKKGATTAESITIEGSDLYAIPDRVITLPSGSIGDIYEIDLYDFGLFINKDSNVLIKVTNKTAGLALIARTA